VAAVATFDSIVVKKFLPDTFHVNSYVQEQLVNIHELLLHIAVYEVRKDCSLWRGGG